MKIYLAPLMAAVIFFSACSREKEKEAEAEKNKLSYKLDSINMIANSRDSTINDLLSSFNEIKENLDSVALRQNIISTEVEIRKGEVKGSSKSHINSQISAINELMDKNRKKIANLNFKMKKYTLNIDQLEKMAVNLNEEIAQKNTDLQTLNGKLNSANNQLALLQTSVDTLSSSSLAKSRIIEDQTASMHTAFYLVGKSKDMEKMKIIDKEGGILGMGKTSKLNSDLDNKNFTRIDYTQVLSIPINSKKAKVVTAHPSDSYRIEKENGEFTNLRILLPEKFWSSTKYLVVLKG